MGTQARPSSHCRNERPLPEASKYTVTQTNYAGGGLTSGRLGDRGVHHSRQGEGAKRGAHNTYQRPHASTAPIAALECPYEYASQLVGVAQLGGDLVLALCLPSCGCPEPGAHCCQAAWPGGHPGRHTPCQSPSPLSGIRCIIKTGVRGSLNSWETYR